MKLRLLRRRHLHTVAPLALFAAPEPERDDLRVFVHCPICRTITFTGFAARRVWQCSGWTTCPNRHVFAYSLGDLFYLDGTAPRKDYA